MAVQDETLKSDGKHSGSIRQYLPGMEGLFRLTFYDITNNGFKWIGEWVNKDETIEYPTWKIDCKKIAVTASS